MQSIDVQKAFCVIPKLFRVDSELFRVIQKYFRGNPKCSHGDPLCIHGAPKYFLDFHNLLYIDPLLLDGDPMGSVVHSSDFSVILNVSQAPNRLCNAMK